MSRARWPGALIGGIPVRLLGRPPRRRIQSCLPPRDPPSLAALVGAGVFVSAIARAQPSPPLPVDDGPPSAVIPPPTLPVDFGEPPAATLPPPLAPLVRGEPVEPDRTCRGRSCTPPACCPGRSRARSCAPAERSSNRTTWRRSLPLLLTGGFVGAVGVTSPSRLHSCRPRSVGGAGQLQPIDGSPDRRRRARHRPPRRRRGLGRSSFTGVGREPEPWPSEARSVLRDRRRDHSRRGLGNS